MTITATDKAGNSTTVTATITINDKTAPIVTAANATVAELAPITPIKVTTDDPTATVGVEGLPPGLSYDPATGEIAGTPDAVGLANKVYAVTITATDPAGNSSTRTINITVLDKTAPDIVAYDWEFDEDVLIEDQGPAYRPLRLISDDPNASYAVSGLPDGLSVSFLSEVQENSETGETNYIRGLVSGAATTPGVYPVTITATDVYGNTARKTVTLTVLDKTPPAITAYDWTFGTDSPIEVQLGRPLLFLSDDPTAEFTVEGCPRAWSAWMTALPGRPPRLACTRSPSPRPIRAATPPPRRSRSRSSTPCRQ